METPPLLIGATLLFWGWQTGLIIFAVIMALLLEGARLAKWRWDISPADFNRSADLCLLLFIIMFIYQYFTASSTKAILIIFQWLPVIFFPLFLSQVYSTNQRVNISALSLLLRKKSTGAISLAYPYFAVCLLSAGAANNRDNWYYIGLFLLCAWALWHIRPKRFSLIVWISLLILIGFMGYVGHIALHNAQIVLEEKGLEWFDSFMRWDQNPYRSKTAIGDIANLKLSDHILFRVKTEFDYERPILLREASYNLFLKSSTWFASKPNFISLYPGEDETTWQFEPAGDTYKSLIVSSYLKRGRGMLKLPTGTFSISQLLVLKLERNRFGAMRVSEGPGLITYRAAFSEDTPLDSPPGKGDLSVPREELAMLSRIIKERKLAPATPQDSLKRVADFFQKNFNYSLRLQAHNPHETPLADFLLRTRSGHCEYFATATVLLLRAAGIPARYASGYLVHEFSDMENSYIVRERHAHAWCLAYVGGAWHDFDTTPAAWIDHEENTAFKGRFFIDFLSWIRFKISAWRWQEEKSHLLNYMGWLLAALILYYAAKLYGNKKVTRITKEQKSKNALNENPGHDSEFYLIEKRLHEMGFERYPWETLSSWIERVKDSHPPTIPCETLAVILDLHYRYRFDPKGITPAEKAALTSSVHAWLTQIECCFKL
ncbi:MAG: DUF4129 domain-containing transglutaminase family protein [bacterium]